MGEQRGLAPLLTVDLAPVTVELNLRESGARFPCKWSSVLEIYSHTMQYMRAAAKGCTKKGIWAKGNHWLTKRNTRLVAQNGCFC